MSTLAEVAPLQVRSTVSNPRTFRPVALRVICTGVAVAVAVGLGLGGIVGVNVAVGVGLGGIVAVGVNVAVGLGLGVGLFPRQAFTFVVWPLVIVKLPVCVPTPALETE